MYVYLAIGSCVLSLMHLEIHALFMIGKSALAVVPIFDDNVMILIAPPIDPPLSSMHALGQ